MTFNWFELNKETGISEEEKRRQIQLGIDDCEGKSHFLRNMTRALRAGITDELIRGASQPDSAIEDSMENVRNRIKKVKTSAVAAQESQTCIDDEFRTLSDLAKEIKTLAHSIGKIGTKARERMNAECPSGKAFLSTLKESIIRKTNERCKAVDLSDAVIDGMVVGAKVEEYAKHMAIKELTEQHMQRYFDRYRDAFSSPGFFLPMEKRMKDRFAEIDKLHARNPRISVPLQKPKAQIENPFEMKKTEDAIQRMKETRAAIQNEIAELRGIDDASMPRRDRLAKDQRLRYLEQSMDEKESQIKKAEEKMARMKWRIDHAEEANLRVRRENCVMAVKCSEEMEKELELLASAYDCKRTALNGLLSEISENAKKTRFRMIPLEKMKEMSKPTYERLKDKEGISRYNLHRLKMFIEAKTVEELKRAYVSIESERIVRFCQAMVLKEAKKAGGIERIVKYSNEDAVVDVLKANSKGVPRHVIRQYVRNGGWIQKAKEHKE